jgi:two-component sensor histidine kinase/CheY-like chemotaxis protein
VKVVMVDDSAPDRRLYRLLLEEALGGRLQVWEEGMAAHGIETCRRVGPDCVLLDYKLPDMTGLEFLTHFHPAEPAEPPAFAVVMLTGLADEQVAVEALKNGAQDYLVKDRITAESLLAAVQRASEKVGLLRTLKAERDRLAESLAEKEVLLKEVHHRVKNNLQVIASLLRLQAGSFADPAMSAALRESQNRVEAMALIHEELYATNDLREVDLAEHAALLAGNLFRSYGEPERIKMNIEVEKLRLGVDRAIPVSLILNELISNALKHGFPGGRAGSIAVRGHCRNGNIDLAVHDDGAGVPEGLEFAKTKSLGLEIVKILTRQLKGTFELERGDGGTGSTAPGTTFRILFPVS